MEQRATHTNTYRKLVGGTTINSETLLSTDYLNHFNELVMLLEMVPDMPDMFEEVKAWQPKTYQEHFRDSSFTHKDLAVMAYEHSPDDYRLPFDQTIEAIHGLIRSELPEIDRTIQQGNADIIREKTLRFSSNLQKLMDRASGIINGVEHYTKGAEELIHEVEAEDTVMNQSAIDSLFD